MTKRLMTLVASAAAVLLLGACTLTISPEPLDSPQPSQTSPRPAPKPSPTPSPAPTPTVPNFPLNENLTYQCTDARLVVRYTSNDSAQIFYNGWENLTRSISTSGRWVYRNDDFAWHASGRTGFLERNGVEVRSDCRY